MPQTTSGATVLCRAPRDDDLPGAPGVQEINVNDLPFEGWRIAVNDLFESRGAGRQGAYRLTVRWWSAEAALPAAYFRAFEFMHYRPIPLLLHYYPPLRWSAGECR